MLLHRITFRREEDAQQLHRYESSLLVCNLEEVRCTRWRSWLRHCATSRKVAGSITDSVVGISHWHNPSGRTMALGFTQPLTEKSTRNISWGVKAAGAYGWPYHLHVPNVLKSGSLNLLESSGSVQACKGIALPLPLLLTCRKLVAMLQRRRGFSGI